MIRYFVLAFGALAVAGVFSALGMTGLHWYGIVGLVVAGVAAVLLFLRFHSGLVDAYWEGRDD